MRETDPNKMSNTEWERWAEARIEELEYYNLGLANESCAQQYRITELEANHSATVEDAALVADENQRLRRIAEAAVRHLEHQDKDGLLNALRAEGYLVQQEDSK